MMRLLAWGGSVGKKRRLPAILAPKIPASEQQHQHAVDSDSVVPKQGFASF
jgi:hypothetical protein